MRKRDDVEMRLENGQQKQWYHCGLVDHLARDCRQGGPGSSVGRRTFSSDREKGGSEVLQLQASGVYCL